MIRPNRRLFLFTSILMTESAYLYSAWGLNGLPVPTYATFAWVSTAGVDQIVAPAYWSLGLFGGWIVHIFFKTRPLSASTKFIDPWKAIRSESSPSSAAPPEVPIISVWSNTTGLA